MMLSNSLPALVDVDLSALSVHIRGLRKTFGDRVVLDNVDLDVARGQFVALLGTSGTGKTTLLRILGGLELPTEGTVLVPQVRTTVFQEPRLVPSKRVLGNVTLGQRRSPAVKAAALAALGEVRLENHARSWPGTLSGGEAQRVALARALVREPELLLLDEPFAALDALTRLAMQGLIVELCKHHGPTVLLVTHDVDESISLADRILVLRDGQFIADVPVELGRPRDRGDVGFERLRRDLLEHLGVREAH